MKKKFISTTIPTISKSFQPPFKNLPKCENCKHFIYHPYESKCKIYFENKKYTDNNLFVHTTYECRNDENKCGYNAKHFEKETNLFNMYKNTDPLSKFAYFIISIYVCLTIGYVRIVKAPPSVSISSEWE
jgi:hypothetical protein